MSNNILWNMHLCSRLNATTTLHKKNQSALFPFCLKYIVINMYMRTMFYLRALDLKSLEISELEISPNLAKFNDTTFISKNQFGSYLFFVKTSLNAALPVFRTHNTIFGVPLHISSTDFILLHNL